MECRQAEGNAIAIVDGYDLPTNPSDFNTFSREFGLPVETSSNPMSVSNKVYTLVYSTGSQPHFNNQGYGDEIALDIEWAHAIAPGAKILLDRMPHRKPQRSDCRRQLCGFASRRWGGLAQLGGDETPVAKPSTIRRSAPRTRSILRRPVITPTRRTGPPHRRLWWGSGARRSTSRADMSCPKLPGTVQEADSVRSIPDRTTNHRWFRSLDRAVDAPTSPRSPTRTTESRSLTAHRMAPGNPRGGRSRRWNEPCLPGLRGHHERKRNYSTSSTNELDKIYSIYSSSSYKAYFRDIVMAAPQGTIRLPPGLRSRDRNRGPDRSDHQHQLYFADRPDDQLRNPGSRNPGQRSGEGRSRPDPAKRTIRRNPGSSVGRLLLHGLLWRPIVYRIDPRGRDDRQRIGDHQRFQPDDSSLGFARNLIAWKFQLGGDADDRKPDELLHFSGIG